MTDQPLSQFLAFQQKMAQSLMYNAMMNGSLERSMMSMMNAPGLNLLRQGLPFMHPGLLHPGAVLSDPALLMRGSLPKPDLLNPLSQTLKASPNIEINQTLKNKTQTPEVFAPQAIKEKPVVVSKPKPKVPVAKPSATVSEETATQPSFEDAKELISSPESTDREFSDYEDEIRTKAGKKNSNKVKSGKKM